MAGARLAWRDKIPRKSILKFLIPKISKKSKRTKNFNDNTAVNVISPCFSPPSLRKELRPFGLTTAARLNDLWFNGQCSMFNGD